MSTIITIDATELHVAAPRVTEFHLRLVDSAATIAGLNFGVEMPAGVKGRVMGRFDAARGDILAAADGVEGLGAEIARRAGLAKLADRLSKLWKVTMPLTQQLSGVSDYHRRAAQRAAVRGDLDSARFNRAYQLKVERLQRGLGAAGNLVGFGPATVADVRNPYISTDRKVGETAARGGTDAALATVTKLALSRAPFVVGGPIGIGIGVAWMVADEKFHLSDKIADGATWAVDKVGDGAQWLDDHALDPAGDAIADGVDEVTPWDGAVPW